MEIIDKTQLLVFGILIGVNVGCAIGWYCCEKFKGNIKKFIDYLEGHDGDI